MSGIEKVRTEHATVGAFASAYVAYLSDLLGGLNYDDVEAVGVALEKIRARGGTLFVIGNGGSASTSSHIGIDLSGVGFKAGSEQPLRVYPLADNVATVTALANDFGYEYVFDKQLAVHWREGDALLAISASGNSPNVVKAAEWVRKRKGTVLGLTGFDGGKLKTLCDVAIVVKTPKGDYGPVEDAHHILNHIFTLWLHLPFSKPRA